ncbi:MAG: hypothetical protein H7A32_02400 [Deltaproteobacteria bacterium]|nr:hypothetical protein [Deltaproteobacteria bacterium]
MEVTESEDGTLSHLSAVFNTRASYAKDEIVLRIEAIDPLGIRTERSYPVSFSKSAQRPADLGPEIAVIQPFRGETVSGKIDVAAEACDESGILRLKLVSSGEEVFPMFTRSARY